MSNILNTKLERQTYPRVNSKYTRGPDPCSDDYYEWYCNEIRQGIIKDSELTAELKIGKWSSLTFTKFYKVNQNNKTLWVVLECYIGSCYGCVDCTESEDNLNETLEDILSSAYISENKEEVEAYYQSKVDAHNLELQQEKDRQEESKRQYNEYCENLNRIKELPIEHRIDVWTGEYIEKGYESKYKSVENYINIKEREINPDPNEKSERMSLFESGTQDVYLIGDPQITEFKTVYRR